jgi:ribosomal 50S subunit-associated protein YjgA (DUF615 family)
MTTLTEFLLARIAEDEEVARYSETRTRSMAECEAKRRIVDLAARMIRDANNATTDKGRIERHLNVVSATAILHALAALYAGHPDYDETWRP